MTEAEKKKLLLHFPMFTSLHDDEYKKIHSYFHYQKEEKNTYLFKEGDDMQGIYFLIEGKIKIYKSNSMGKEQLVNIYSEGDIFPHIGHYFHSRACPANALILHDATFFIIPIEQIESLLLQSPIVSTMFLSVMGEKVIDLQSRLEDKMLGTTTEQVINLLLRLAKKYGQKTADQKIQLSEVFQNTDLGNMIGLTRETVSRTMAVLYTDNVIEKDKENRLVIDIEKINMLQN